MDLAAKHDGVLRIVRTMERIDAIDGLSVFSAFDGQAVAADALVGSRVKTGPHLVDRRDLELAEVLGEGRRDPVIDVRPFRPSRIGALVRESLADAGRRRFEAGLRSRVTALGSAAQPRGVRGRRPRVEATLRTWRRGSTRVDVLLTAARGLHRPAGPGVRGAGCAGWPRGEPRGAGPHPGSMLILRRPWKTTIIGLPTCGAYSKATAVDLLLPWLLSGEPPTRATVARLAHGGILDRDQRFRFLVTRRSSRRPADRRLHAVTWVHQPANERQARRQPAV